MALFASWFPPDCLTGSSGEGVWLPDWPLLQSDGTALLPPLSGGSGGGNGGGGGGGGGGGAPPGVTAEHEAEGGGLQEL
jgi:hypothetical protein